MMRVLHVIDHLGLGGAQSALLDIVSNTDPAHARCEVAVMHGRGVFADAMAGRGIEVHSLSRAKWPPAYLANFVRLLREKTYDIVHFHLPGANWIAKPLGCLFSRAKRVAHDHSSADLAFRGWWSVPPDSFAHLFSSHVVAVSEGVAGFLAARELVPRRKISVVANGIDTRLFAPAADERREKARAALGLKRDDFVAGAIGRLAAEKNFPALVALARAEPDLQFVVAGDGPDRESLRRSARDLPNFHLLGSVSDRPAFYAALDVFLLPSLHEALPMALLEAMAAGVPVIASDLEGVSEALGSSGILVPAGDVDALARALRSVASDPAGASARARQARERVEKNYDARDTAAKLVGIYRSLLSK